MEQALLAQLKALYELNLQLSRIETLDLLFREAVALGCQWLGFDRMAILLLEQENERKVVVGTYGINRHGALTDIRHLRYPFDQSWQTVYEALQSQQRVSIRPDWPLYDGREQVGRGWVAAALLWDGDEAIGWLSVDNLLNQQPLQEEQVELLSFYGATLGHLITHLQAQEALRAREATERRFQEKLRALHEVTTELSKAATLDDLCRRAVELGRARLGFDRIGLWLYDAKAASAIGTFGTDDDGLTRDEWAYRYEISPGSAIHDALENKLPLVFEGHTTLNDQPWGGRKVSPGWRAVAFLWDGEQHIGWLSVDNLLYHRPIEDYQLELLTLYGSAVGHLLTNLLAQEALRTREATERRFQEQLKVLHEVTTDLSRAETLDDLYRQAVELGRARLGFDRLGLWLHDAGTDLPIGTFGTDEHGQTRDERAYRDKTAPGSMQYALETKLPLVFMEQVELTDEPWGRGNLGIGWLAVALLWDGEQHIGWLSADNLLRHQPIEDYQLELLQLYASAVGHLITSKQAQEALRAGEESERRLRQALEVLLEVGAELTRAASLDDLFRQAVILARERLGFDRIGIFLVNDDYTEMVGTFGTDTQGGLRDEHYLREPIPSALDIREALQTRARLKVWEDTDLYDNWKVVGRGWNALSLLWDRETVLGWIVADNLLRQQPLEDYQREVLKLYGEGVGSQVVLRRTETALRQQETLRQNILRAAPVGIGMVVNRVFHWTNERFQQMVGYEAAELIGQSARLIYPDDAEYVRVGQVKYAEIAAHGIGTLETRLQHKDGRRLDVLMSSVPLDSGDFSQGVIFSALDISARKAAEDALRASEARYRALYEQISDAVFIIGLDYVISQANWQAAELLRCPLDAIVGQHAEVFIVPRELEASRGRFGALLAGEALPVYERTFLRPDGSEFPGEISLSLVHKDDGTPSHFQSVVRDISTRKAAERARLELALQQDRVELLKEFIGKVIHDLKNPLSVINSNLFLLKRLSDPEKQARQIASVQQQANRLDRIIQDVLEILRLDYLPGLLLEPTDPAALARDTLAEMQSFIESKSLTLRVGLPSDLPFVQGSRDELGRALLNLLENAVHYTPTGGLITMRARHSGDSLVIEVQDSGIGIAPEDLPFITERSYRAANAKQTWAGGTGLGLAMVKKIMEMHGGSLEIESELGRGSTFRLRLPVVPAAAAAV